MNAIRKRRISQPISHRFICSYKSEVILSIHTGILVCTLPLGLRSISNPINTIFFLSLLP